MVLSNGPGGTEYWLWDFKKNYYEKYSKFTNAELRNIIESSFVSNETKYGIYIEDLSQELNYEETLSDTKLYLNEYLNSWKLLL